MQTYLKYTTFHTNRYITVKIAFHCTFLYACLHLFICHMHSFVLPNFSVRKLPERFGCYFYFKTHIVYNDKDFMEETYTPSPPDQLASGGWSSRCGFLIFASQHLLRLEVTLTHVRYGELSRGVDV